MARFDVGDSFLQFYFIENASPQALTAYVCVLPLLAVMTGNIKVTTNKQKLCAGAATLAGTATTYYMATQTQYSHMGAYWAGLAAMVLTLVVLNPPPI